MPRPRFGSRKFTENLRRNQIEVLPERKIFTFDDFRRGYTPSEQRRRTEPNASPNARDWIIREDNRLQRAPGTSPIEFFGDIIESDYDESFVRVPSRLALHPTLNESVELVLFSPPEIGFRNQTFTAWHNLGLKPKVFAHTTFGGTFIFTDGYKVFYRSAVGATPKEHPEIPVARDYVSFGGRVFAFATIIEGRFEPLGVRWSSADSNYRDWKGLGAGFELLINDVSTGDKIQNAIPMSLDTIAVVLSNSIWIGRFTGLRDRPANFSVSAPRVGAINRRVAKLSRFGVITLHNSGVYIFDGNTPTLISRDINSELLPIDHSNLEAYHAAYDPGQKRYILFTPTDCWVYEIEHNRWLRRTFTSLDAVVYPDQIDPTRWFELVGDWNNQSDFQWLDYAGRLTGDLFLQMLGDQVVENYDYDSVVRVLAQEDPFSWNYFGKPYSPYWETPMVEEQDAARLVAITKQLIEYEGSGNIRIHLPDRDGQYVPTIDLNLGQRNYPALAVANAVRLSKGTGIGVELLPDVEEPEDYDEEDFS